MKVRLPECLLPNTSTGVLSNLCAERDSFKI
jgi:hypothetical protein